MIRAIGPGAAQHYAAGSRRPLVVRARLPTASRSTCLFTENETNFQRIDNVPNKSPYRERWHQRRRRRRPKDARSTPSKGSKLAGHAHAVVPAGGTFSVEVRFSPAALAKPFADFDAVFASRIAEADAFYDALHPPTLGADEQLGRAAGLRGPALVEAVLSLRRLPLAQGRSDPAAAARSALERSQLALEGAAQRRRDPDARHVGVSLVRVVGSGVPLRGDGPHRSRVRQGAAAEDGLRMVSARQRPVPGLRMELRRCESARHRLGGVARLSDRPRPHRHRRRRVSQRNLPERDAELQLLGQPQRQQRPRRLRRRLSGDGQHRRVRPRQAASRRRPARTERRHQLDGALLHHDAHHLGRARPGRLRSTRTWRSSTSSTSSTSPTR